MRGELRLGLGTVRAEILQLSGEGRGERGRRIVFAAPAGDRQERPAANIAHRHLLWCHATGALRRDAGLEARADAGALVAPYLTLLPTNLPPWERVDQQTPHGLLAGCCEALVQPSTEAREETVVRRRRLIRALGKRPLAKLTAQEI